jgi:type II secretory pathway component PulK
MILLTALMTMAVLAVVLTVVTAQVVAQRQMLRQRERRLQADWAARAAVEHAVARLIEAPKEFSEENRELVPDSKIKIEVSKTGDVFVIRADADVGLPDEKALTRTVTARFRRDKNGAMTRLFN